MHPLVIPFVASISCFAIYLGVDWWRRRARVHVDALRTLGIVTGDLPAAAPLMTVQGWARFGPAGLSHAPSRLLLFADCMAIVSESSAFPAMVIQRESVERLSLRYTFADTCMWIFGKGGTLFDVRFVVRSRPKLRKALAHSSWLSLVQKPRGSVR